jgi:hypothetical protein
VTKAIGAIRTGHVQFIRDKRSIQNVGSEVPKMIPFERPVLEEEDNNKIYF